MLRTKLLCMKKATIKILDKHLSGESMDFRQVISIILPLLVDQAFIVLLGLLNTAMVSSSGETAVAAVSMVDSLNIFLLNVFIALATGGTVIVAQYKGAGNPGAFSKAAEQAVISVTIMALLISAVAVVFRNPLLILLFGKSEQAVFDNARLYLIGSVITYPLFAVTESVCGALRGLGETKATLCLSLIKNGTYVIFNLLFISILHLGIMGLIISLIVSRLIGMICSLIYIRIMNKTVVFRFRNLLKVDFSMLRRIMFIGIPFAAEQMFFNGGKLLTQTFIVFLGTDALAVNAICNSTTTLPQIGSLACNLAAVTVVGQCVGHGNYKDARKFIRSFLFLGSISVLVSDILLLPFLHLIIGLFSPAPDIIAPVYFITIITWVSTPFLWSVSFITPSALRAAGDARFTLVTSLITMWLVRVVLGFILSVILPFGITGVWVAMIIEWSVRGVIFLLRMRGSKWQKHKLLD